MGDEWPIPDVFDDDYLHFYEPRLNKEASDAEADLVWELLELKQGAAVLDLACGHGRIANPLAQRLARVTGLDATPLFLELATQEALERGVSVDYVEGDMRSLPWTDQFDAVVSWFTAFGYFDDQQNRDVLAGVYRALRPGGRFLVELNHKDGLLPHWLPATVDHIGDDRLIEERSYDPVTGRSNTRRTVIRNGAIRQSSFFVRMFSFTELRDWLLQAGFRQVTGFAGDGTALTATARRMIVVAER